MNLGQLYEAMLGWAGEKLGERYSTPVFDGAKNEDVLSKITEIGLTTVIIAVAAYGLDKTWLGKQLTKSNIALLIKKSKICKFNATGEGGEYDTFVLDGPLFKKKLVIDKSTEHWFGDRGNLEINDVISYNKERIL